MIGNVLKFTLTLFAQYKRNVTQAYFMHNLSFMYALSIFQQYRTLKNRNFERPKMSKLLLDYNNQSGWGMSVSLKGCEFEHTELSIRFESFNDECAIVK